MAKKLLVVLDPGHYPNYNKGAVAGYYEGDKMYELSLYQRDALQKYGIDVIITRGRDYDMELYARGQVAVKKGAGYSNVVFISNHSNGANGKAYGVEAIRSAFLPDSAELGKKLIDAIVGIMKPYTGITNNRGVKTRKGNNGDYYGVIRGSVSGAKSNAQASKGRVQYSYIIEHGFHDNAKECAFLVNSANLKKIAEAEAKVIVEYFGITGKTVKPTTTTESSNTSETVFDVQTWLNNNYNTGLKTDGIYGPLTKEALIKAWQTIVGGLTVDGDYGPKSKEKAKTAIIKRGSVGDLVKVWQAFLVCVRIDPNGIDGDFGIGCHKATVKYQTDNGLTPDGIVGVNTWTKAFN